MPLSQFTVFSSGDAAGPGLMQNSNGDAIRILTACLVTGYSGKTAVNWTNPIATASNIAVYRPPSGARMHLVVGDDGTGAIGLGAKAAYMTGWETVAGIATPVGSGTGQFPTPAQYGSVGAVILHKHNGSAGGRPWTLFADAYGFYFFVDIIGDGISCIAAHGFGDIYSYSTSTDSYRCQIFGNSSSSVSAAGAFADRVGIGEGTAAAPWEHGSRTTYMQHYMARAIGGGGSSIHVTPIGDSGSLPGTGYCYTKCAGKFALGGNNGQFIAPMRLIESNGTVRGRWRGLYHPCHLAANYSNGLTFSGGGDYAGKTFMAMGPGGSGGTWIVETSATVQNN